MAPLNFLYTQTTLPKNQKSMCSFPSFKKPLRWLAEFWGPNGLFSRCIARVPHNYIKSYKIKKNHTARVYNWLHIGKCLTDHLQVIPGKDFFKTKNFAKMLRQTYTPFHSNVYAQSWACIPVQGTTEVNFKHIW